MCFYWSPFHSWSYQSCFLGLRKRHPVLYPERTFATADHNTPTINQHFYPLKTHYQPTTSIRRKFQRIWITGIRDKNGIVHVGSWKRNYITSLLLFAEIHILPPTVPLCHMFWIGTWGRNGPFYAMYHATKTQKDAYSRRWWSSIGSYTKRRCIIYHPKLSTSGATGYFV
jgi:3-isopropylmalate/(R)-2-methylmalate dehydratase large subunit